MTLRVKVFGQVEVNGSYQRRDLTKMIASTRNIAGISEAGLPIRRRKFAHFALLLAWSAFWLNTAFVPCCEAIAAASDDHAEDVAQSVAVQSHTHGSYTTDGEHPHHVPASPCDQTPNALRLRGAARRSDA